MFLFWVRDKYEELVSLSILSFPRNMRLTKVQSTQTAIKENGISVEHIPFFPSFLYPFIRLSSLVSSFLSSATLDKYVPTHSRTCGLRDTLNIH